MSSVDTIVDRVQGDPGYIKFLLLEAPYIRSALYARGVCLDEEYRIQAPPTTIGNAMHCDLIELEAWLRTLPVKDAELLLHWAASSQRVQRSTVSRPKIRRAQRLAQRAAEHLEGVDEQKA